jgi:hypothetical protein
MNVRVGGVWKAATPSVKVAGVWKPAASGWVKVAGVWRQFYAAAPAGPPAVTLYAGGSLFNTTAGDKAVTVTPAVGDLIIVVAAASGLNNTSSCTDNQGGTYAVGASCLKDAGGSALTLLIRNSLVSTTAAHVITSTQSGSTGGGLFALKVTNMTAAGAAAKRAAANQHNGTQATTPAPVLGGVPLSKNPVIGAVFLGGTATITPRAGYTELADATYTVPGTGVEIMARDSGETSATITWGSAAGGGDFGAVCIELSAP